MPILPALAYRPQQETEVEGEMAKRGTLEHPKTLDLAGRLGIMEPFALGLLEAFWNWVGKYHPAGDVTNVRPALLASSIRFRGDADALWRELQDCGFVDMADGQLIVHDWSDHADDFIHTTLARRCERFADGTIPNSRRLNKDERERFHHWLDTENAPTITPIIGGESAKCLPQEAQETAEKMTVPSLAVPSHAMPEEKALAPASPPPAVETPVPPAVPVNPKLELVPPAVKKQCQPIDSRFTPFRKAIESYWQRANPGVEMPWDASESKRLHEFLKACPGTALDAFERMLANRERSDVVQSHRPRVWIAALTDYANGPIDRYGKPALRRTPEAAVGIYKPDVSLEDPVMDLAWEADRDSSLVLPPHTVERHVAVAEAINAKRSHPLRTTSAEIRAAVEQIFSMRGRLNKILHSNTGEVREC
jgi:hypothetical protein